MTCTGDARGSLNQHASGRRDPIALATPPCPPRSTGVAWRLELWFWAGRTAVRGTWVHVGHSLPLQVNPRSRDWALAPS